MSVTWLSMTISPTGNIYTSSMPTLQPLQRQLPDDLVFHPKHPARYCSPAVGLAVAMSGAVGAAWLEELSHLYK